MCLSTTQRSRRSQEEAGRNSKTIADINKLYWSPAAESMNTYDTSIAEILLVPIERSRKKRRGQDPNYEQRRDQGYSVFA
jgi:hypothetical protein